MKRILVAILLLAPLVFAQDQPKRQLSEAEVRAKMDKHKALLWYVVEPMGVPCAQGSAQWFRDHPDETPDGRYGRYLFRLEATTFEELMELDPKTTTDLDPKLKEILKRQVAHDLVHMYRLGACKGEDGW